MPANNSPSGSKMPFLNGEMLALNVMTVPIEQSIVTEFASLAGGAPDPTSFASVRPPWHSDIEWISARTETAFATFESAFERLDIAKWVEPYVDYDTQIRMFGGFVVLRSQCDEPSFHLDWHDGNNNGFNLLTPITDNGAGFGLIYKKLDGSVGSYDHKMGEAIIIGSNFVHSTAPGRSERPVALLSFTFGTDKLQYWDALSVSAANQGPLYRRPDGLLCRNHRLNSYK